MRKGNGKRQHAVVQTTERAPLHVSGPSAPNGNGLSGEIAAVSARATEVFGSREKALRWLDTPVPSLGYRTPLSLLSTENGVAEVQDTLGAIEHGVW